MNNKPIKESKSTVFQTKYTIIFWWRFTVVKLRLVNSKKERKIYELLKQPGFRVDQVYDVAKRKKKKDCCAISQH